MMPGIPGGTQLAMGESCGGLAAYCFCSAVYAGVSANCCGGPKSPAPVALPRAARRPPKVISQTPLKSGNSAIDAHVPPGNLDASAALQAEGGNKPRPSSGRASKARSIDVLSFKR